jgi:RalA-binding protein 1
MGDSPAPSPVLGSGFPGQALHPQGQPSPAPSESVMLEPDSSVPPPPAPMTNPFEESEAGESEFLDMGQGDHDDENDGDEEGDDEDEDVDDEGPGSGNHQQQQSRTQPSAQVQQPPSTQPLATDGRSPGKAARAAVEDFPLPPGFGSSSGAHVPGPIQQGPLHAHVQAHAHAQAQALAHAQAQARAQGQGLEYQQPQRSRADPEISGPYSQSNLDSESYSSPYLPNAPSSSSSTSLMNSAQSQTLSLMSTSTTSPAFRALPLLATDLPQTRISVSHSSIRPNDRGKEVLSFIIVVDPGRGKETWNVEKLYSDVLGLDQRIRASVGKGVGKKIASLPEGKLWRDHAPAKVDQRKVCSCSDLADYHL